MLNIIIVTRNDEEFRRVANELCRHGAWRQRSETHMVVYIIYDFINDDVFILEREYIRDGIVKAGEPHVFMCPKEFNRIKNTMGFRKYKERLATRRRSKRMAILDCLSIILAYIGIVAMVSAVLQAYFKFFTS